jgi:MFS family permease
MMQKFILFLHHPVFSIAVTLTGFLVLSGLGSAWSGRLLQTRSRRQVLLMAVVAIALFVVLYVLTLPVVFDWMMGIPVWLKVMVTIVLIAPLAFFMGMPFPLALGSLDENAKSYIPWAWAINGCASVMSAVLATILAIHFGFTTVLFLAILLYVGTLFVLPAPRRAKR